MLKKSAIRLGIDRAVSYTLLARVWQAMAGLCSIFLIAKYFSPIEQGYFYTFSSILALQIFFELGLTYVVMQFTSHEMANLSWSSDRLIKGDAIANARLGSLMRMTLKWYLIAANLFWIIALPAGTLFFSTTLEPLPSEVWQLPWTYLVVLTAGMLFISPIFAILEGCNLMAEVARFRTIQDIVAYTVFWYAVSSGAGLFSISLLPAIRILMSISWLFWFYRGFIWSTIQFKKQGVKIDWRNEFWPLQWKIALTSMGGYFYFYLFTPILFTYYGPVEAGKMGMSLSVIGALNTACMTWMNTKTPLFCRLIALKKFNELDDAYFQTLKKSLIISIIAYLSTMLFLIILKMLNFIYAERLLDILPFSLMLGGSFINVIIFSHAAYLRSHKQEPLLIYCLTMAILNTLIGFFIGREYSAVGMAAGSFLLTLIIGLPWATIVFNNTRQHLHHANLK